MSMNYVMLSIATLVTENFVFIVRIGKYVPHVLFLEKCRAISAMVH